MKRPTTTHGLSPEELIELGILSLALSLAVTAGFIALPGAANRAPRIRSAQQLRRGRSTQAVELL